MAGPDRHGRGRRGARRVQEAPHAVIRRLFAATVSPRVFQVWEVSGDREYRICRVYSETVYNRCIIKYMPVLRSDVRGRDPGGGIGKIKIESSMHTCTAARIPRRARLPSRDRHRPDRSAVSRAPRPEVRSRGARSGPPPGSRPVEKRTRGAAPRGRGGRRAGVRGRTRQPDETGQPARDGHGGAGCAAARSVSPVFLRPRPRGPNAGATP
jgi:hypothetical protein